MLDAAVVAVSASTKREHAGPHDEAASSHASGQIADAQGVQLNGVNNYRFRIPPEGIPAEAFWSLTLYEVDPHGGMYFTANVPKRYAVGNRTQGLHKNLDGSIDIWISHTQPVEVDRQANWLPAPAGVFRLLIRAYAPSESFQSGQVLPPAIERCANT